MLDRFLSMNDEGRTTRALKKLVQHRISSWVLTGGLATEIHHELLGYPSGIRRLNDIDFITESFDSLPASLARDFLFRHIHPFDPPGKTILQAIDPDEALRIDVFRAYGAEIDRASALHLANVTIRLISLQDLVARTTRLLLDLTEGVPVPAKHVHDYLRLIRLLPVASVETVWEEHRKPNHPLKFTEANELLRVTIPLNPNLLITPQFSTDVAAGCSRCAPTSTFELADSKSMLALLGYC